MKTLIQLAKICYYDRKGNWEDLCTRLDEMRVYVRKDNLEDN